mmetsp:Transcript_6662/g.14534  ORF Transcript_6662/g.14534 Transcript_6662/m.14534 type:complete len:363 (+) Transcript_6662:123-1211(+)
MGNQQANGAGGMSSRRSGGGYSQQQHSSPGGQYRGSSSSKPPPGGAAPEGYMRSHQQQYPGGGEEGGGQNTVKRSASDQSMTDMTSTGHSAHDASVGSSQRLNLGDNPIPLDLATISAAEEDAVPTVFRWEHGGRNVYITGTFNGWSRQIPMHRSGNDFTYIHNLKRGKHAFKFIVDDEWRFAPDQPTVADIEGRINNFIDVTDFKAYTGDKEFENERHADHCSRAAEAAQQQAAAAAASSGSTGTGSTQHPGGSGKDDASSTGSKDGKGQKGAADLDGEVYGHSMPDLDEYTKEPPPLPPHLRHIILNKPPQLQDTAALPVPQHVALNHLYCTAIKDNMMVLGITQRYKTKSCTTVYYSPC